MPTSSSSTAPRALSAPLINPHQSWWSDVCRDDGRSIASLLQMEAAGGRYQRSVYELFAEMEEKDGHLFSVLSTRVNGLLGLPRTIQPAHESNAARSTARFVEETLAGIPRLEELLHTLTEGIARGFAVVELLWGYDPRGRLVPVDWIAHPQELFLFDARGRLHLLAPPFRVVGGEGIDPAPLAAGRGIVPAERAVPAPPRKFLVLAFGRDARNPYGRGLCQRAYYYSAFKRGALRQWAIHNERFGAPTAVATYSPGTTDEDRRHVLEVLESLQTEAGVVVPESIRLELLEGSARSSDGRAFRDLADWCNDEMSRIVLGATLATSEGRRSGSLALGTVHDAVRQDYVEADARLLSEVITGQLVRWIVDLNEGEAAPAPRWLIDATPPSNLEEQVRVDRELVRLGVPLSLAQFYTRYGRSVPRAGEQMLQYDDANLFQYHLRYGVLTINEVRARLHLPPVPWGDRPTGESTILSPTQLPTSPPGGWPRDDSPEETADPSERRNEPEPKER
jgi:phage gp29-like protein